MSLEQQRREATQALCDALGDSVTANQLEQRARLAREHADRMLTLARKRSAELERS